LKGKEKKCLLTKTSEGAGGNALPETQLLYALLKRKIIKKRKRSNWIYRSVPAMGKLGRKTRGVADPGRTAVLTKTQLHAIEEKGKREAGKAKEKKERQSQRSSVMT